MPTGQPPSNEAGAPKVSVISSTQSATATSVTVPASGGVVVSTVLISTCSAPANGPSTVDTSQPVIGSLSRSR